jgi:hypothetical protein
MPRGVLPPAQRRSGRGPLGARSTTGRLGVVPAAQAGQGRVALGHSLLAPCVHRGRQPVAWQKRHKLDERRSRFVQITHSHLAEHSKWADTDSCTRRGSLAGRPGRRVRMVAVAEEESINQAPGSMWLPQARRDKGPTSEATRFGGQLQLSSMLSAPSRPPPVMPTRPTSSCSPTRTPTTRPPPAARWSC